MSTDTLTKDKVLRMERVIAASPERLFALWSEPEELVKWWGPEGFTTPKYTMDVRPGGRWRTTMHSPDGKDHTVSGIYRAIEPPKRLVFTWGWDDAAGMRGHETEITVTFEPTSSLIRPYRSRSRASSRLKSKAARTLSPVTSSRAWALKLFRPSRVPVRSTSRCRVSNWRSN